MKSRDPEEMPWGVKLALLLFAIEAVLIMLMK